LDFGGVCDDASCGVVDVQLDCFLKCLVFFLIVCFFVEGFYIKKLELSLGLFLFCYLLLFFNVYFGVAGLLFVLVFLI
jgi:hypothetical protein